MIIEICLTPLNVLFVCQILLNDLDHYLDPIVIFILHEHLSFLPCECYKFFHTLNDNFFKLSPF